MNKIKNKYLLLAGLALAIFVVGVLKADFSEVTNFNKIEVAGPIISGDSQITAANTLPTASTASNFAHWLPVYNVGPAVTQGDVLVSSNVVGGVAFVNIAPATTDLTTIVGVAAESIASGARGWMVGRGSGFAVVKTTGTVTIGDLLVSTTSASGRLTGDSTPTTGADVATAMSVGTAAGGTVIAILH